MREQAWEEFRTNVGPVFPVMVTQLEMVIQETGRAAEGLIECFQAISQRAKEHVSEAAELAGVGGGAMAMSRVPPSTLFCKTFTTPWINLFGRSFIHQRSP